MFSYMYVTVDLYYYERLADIADIDKSNKVKYNAAGRVTKKIKTLSLALCLLQSTDIGNSLPCPKKH